LSYSSEDYDLSLSFDNCCFSAINFIVSSVPILLEVM
jgi:hypothetical protein